MQQITTIDKQFYAELGKEIRRIREHKNITQKELAQETGFSRPIIINHEYGYSKLKPRKWERICKALGISPDIKIEVKIGER